MKESSPQDYQWLDCNPSENTPLAVINSNIFEANGECWWMRYNDERREQLFGMTNEAYRADFPNLFTQLEFFSAGNAQVLSIYEASETMNYYYRGAEIALFALQASRENDLTDISHDYLVKLEQLEMEDTKWWLYAVAAYTNSARGQLHDFIELDYAWGDEPDYLKSAMQIGAKYTYILMTHHDSCLTREAELAWEAHESSVLYQSERAWLQYESNHFGSEEYFVNRVRR